MVKLNRCRIRFIKKFIDINIIYIENSSGIYANMTTAVYSHPEVVPTLLRQNVDYSFYFVLMGKFNT